MKKTIILLTIFICNYLTVIAQINKDFLWIVSSKANKPDIIQIKYLCKYTLEGYHYSLPINNFYNAKLQYGLAKSKALKKQKVDVINNKETIITQHKKNEGNMSITISSKLC